MTYRQKTGCFFTTKSSYGTPKHVKLLQTIDGHKDGDGHLNLENDEWTGQEYRSSKRRNMSCQRCFKTLSTGP